MPPNDSPPTPRSIQRARAAWAAQLRHPLAVKTDRGLGLPAHPGTHGCFLGQACIALKARRFLADVDDQSHVFYGEEHHPYGDKHLPRELCQALNITPYGKLSVPLRCTGRDNHPITIRSVAALNDLTDLSLREFADLLEADSLTFKPYDPSAPDIS